eukprot:6491797-Amphidinium_carterae.2
MATCSFTSHFSEKQHSSAALFKKRHDYNTSTLITRSFITPSGRQCFLCEIMKARMNKSVPLKLRKLSPQAIMVQHGTIWAGLSAEKKEKYERMAKAMRDHRAAITQSKHIEQTHQGGYENVICQAHSVGPLWIAELHEQ